MTRILVALIVAVVLLEGLAVYLALNYGAFAPITPGADRAHDADPSRYAEMAKR